MSYRPSYRYRVVSNNGAGVYGHETGRLARAKEHAEELAGAWPENGPFEIERLLYLPDGGRRYWVRQRSRWVPWDSRRNAEARQPDWVWPSVASEGSGPRGE